MQIFETVVDFYCYLEHDSNDNEFNTVKPQTSHDGNDKLDIHSASQAVLPLLDWEKASLALPYDNDDSCQYAPSHVDDACCLGVQAQENKLLFNRQFCSHVTARDYEQLQANLQDYLASPEQSLPSSNNNNDLACDVCQIVESLRRYNYEQKRNFTFALFGDSMTYQAEQGLACELQRRNYNVTLENIKLNFAGDGHRNIRKFKRRTVRSSLWPPGQFVVLDFLKQYNIPFLSQEQKDLVASYDILIASFGLHYVHTPDRRSVMERDRYNQKTYHGHLGDFFSYVREKGNVKVLAHRETAARHFDADGGEFTLARILPSFANSTCVPVQNADVALWRQRGVEKAAAFANYTLVQTGRDMARHVNDSILYSIPWFEFTLPLHTFHRRKSRPGEGLDCVHFCSTPHLYQPIWRGVRLAMDHQLRGTDHTMMR